MRRDAQSWIMALSALTIAVVLTFGCVVCSGVGGVIIIQWLHVQHEMELDRQDPFRKFR